MATTAENITTDVSTIGLTATAATKVQELLSREIAASPDEHEGKEYALRVAVQPGGCAGLRYALYFDDRKLDGDQAETINGVEIRVDKMSAPYLRGAEIDYLDTLEQSGFTINNPNAKGSCACGDSAHF
ncbi:MAG TPA: iron-sulfur cluster assembly accessory protein [Actinomycetota bacterium]|nr:iron-sulfur cluster assembly accessory protein [Actinomycetota bacterium]